MKIDIQNLSVSVAKQNNFVQTIEQNTKMMGKRQEKNLSKLDGILDEA